MRLTGLASGMDIDSMVAKLMKAQRLPLDKLNQQKQLVEWKRDGYREISSKLITFSNTNLMNLSLSSSTQTKKAEVSGTAGVLSASATGSASTGSLDISVQQLAKAASTVSTTGIGNKSGSTLISDISTETKITINDVDINIDAADTIDSMVAKINNNKDAGVTAVYDPTLGKLSLTNKATGADAQLSFSGDIIDQFNLAPPTGGQNAKLTVNGISMQQTSNRFTLNGVEINLTGVHSTGQSSKIEVVQDTDKIVDNVKQFVTAYNEILAALNSKSDEERYLKYTPLTSEQKEDMKEDEIKLWEDKAKSGMLKNDSILRQAISDMRSAIIEDIDLGNGKKINLADLGITTGTWSEKGKLYLDEDKLKQAIASDPDVVANAFSSGKIGSSGTSQRYDATDGIYTRLRKISSTSLESMAQKAGTSKTNSDLNASFLATSLMGVELRNIDNRITTMNSLMTRKESQYYKQFTAMEVAINKYNSISGSLTSFLS
ncbi:flagellar filament capping protein FliD [Paenibacillus illinoisensis]|uniref:flagellar filament capping protein FliD n=1 Tax=Paenibacillus illinoisensis TaxID=59845 RepID=UPI000FD9D8ED|nr:flagellar filament capping protein FliD [Paenibacillus illinoisensis]